MLNSKSKIIIIIAILAGIFGGVVFMEDDIDIIDHQITYKNATTITGVGFSSDSGNNTQLISEINNGYWVGVEQNTPWQIYIYFTNVTEKIRYVETMHKYNSTGAATNHIVTRYIWCVAHNDWIAIEEFTNENNWFYLPKVLVDSDHFVLPNQTVIIKYDHPATGNVAHRLNIDVSRLVYVENIVMKD